MQQLDKYQLGQENWKLNANMDVCTLTICANILRAAMEKDTTLICGPYMYVTYMYVTYIQSYSCEAVTMMTPTLRVLDMHFL